MRTWLLALLLVPGAGAEALLVAVVPDLSVPGPGDEGFALAPTHGSVSLAGWSVTDGEGTWALPPLVLDRETWFVGDAAAWAARDGPSPAGVFGTTLRLANGGDDLRLLDGAGREVDAFTYGSDAGLGFAGADLVWRRLPAADVDPEGLEVWRGNTTESTTVAAAGAAAAGTTDAGAGAAAAGTTEGGGAGAPAAGTTGTGGAGASAMATHAPEPAGWIDTDTADDWRTPRIHRVGESRLEMPVFEVDALTAYASPDSTFDVVTQVIDEAQQRLHLHVYELRSRALVDSLAAAAARGVDVHVLVTARPVGQEPDERHETADALQRIEAAGGHAWLAEGGRYRYHHLKVLVADGAVAIQSENWVPSGVPADPSWGNRGWGVVLHDREAADWFAEWMAADRAAWDTVPFELAAYDPLFEPPPRFAVPSGVHRGRVPAQTFSGPVLVTPVVTPDATHDPRFDPTFAAAAAATGRLWAQQLDFTTGWSNDLGWSDPDGLREALRDAGRRGLDARVMAAGPFRLEDTGNAEAMAALPADGVATCTFALPDLVLHNKGLIADDVVYVGSMNGNHHSRSMNREVGVLIDDRRVSGYFAALFESDWEHCAVPGAWDALVPAPGPTLFAALLVLTAHRCCRPSPSPHSSSSPQRWSSPGRSGSWPSAR